MPRLTEGAVTVTVEKRMWSQRCSGFAGYGSRRKSRYCSSFCLQQLGEARGYDTEYVLLVLRKEDGSVWAVGLENL